MDQRGCRYIPHVMGVMVGQPFKILNSDGILHNVHALPKTNKEFNMAMPASRTEAIETFTKVEGMFVIKCDVHPWMKAYIEVMSHPFFDVTEARTASSRSVTCPPGPTRSRSGTRSSAPRPRGHGDRRRHQDARLHHEPAFQEVIQEL